MQCFAEGISLKGEDDFLILLIPLEEFLKFSKIPIKVPHQ